MKSQIIDWLPHCPFYDIYVLEQVMCLCKPLHPKVSSGSKAFSELLVIVLFIGVDM